MRIKSFAFETSISIARGVSRAGHGRRGDLRLTVGEHPEDDAAQRPRPIIDADERLKAAVAGLQLVGQQRSALSAQAPFVKLTTELKVVPVDGSIDAIGPRRTEEGDIILGIRLPLGEIDHGLGSRVQPHQIADREPDQLCRTGWWRRSVPSPASRR